MGRVYLGMQAGFLSDLKEACVRPVYVVGIRREDIAVALEIFPLWVAERHD
jgi:hypothetical protein